MKKYCKLINIIFWGLFTTTVWAVDDISIRNVRGYPIQPILIYDDSTAVINPFEMLSFGVGKIFTSHHVDIKDDIGPTFKKLKWFDDASIHKFGDIISALIDNIAVKVEVPYYQDRVSLGFDHHRISKVIDKTPGQYDVRQIRDILFTAKAKLPFNTNLGYLALTFAPKVGFIYGHHYYSKEMSYRPDLNSYGIAMIGALGIDYYLNQWFGLYGEFSVRYNHIRWFVYAGERRPTYLDDKSKNVPELKPEPKPEPYGYFTTSFTFGIKSNF